MILRRLNSKSTLKQRLCWSLALCLLTISRTTITAEISESSINFDGKYFSYTFESYLEAPRDNVIAILHRFDQWHKLNDKITTSDVLSRTSKNNLKRLLTLTQCVLTFCFDLKFVETVSLSETMIEMLIQPAESNFSEGKSVWRIDAFGPDSTRIRVKASMAPDFWIPPLIGPLILEKVFLNQITSTCSRIEKLASLAQNKSN